MSDFFGKLKNGAGKVAFEADKLTRLNKAKGDLEKIKDQILAQYSKLGELYYTQRAIVGVTGPAYDQICQGIVELEQQARAKSEEIQHINAESYTPQGEQPVPRQTQGNAAPAAPEFTPVPVKKFCPNCGKEIPAGVKFCPDCGTNLADL